MGSVVLTLHSSRPRNHREEKISFLKKKLNIIFHQKDRLSL